MDNQTFTELFENIQNSIEKLFEQYQWLDDKEHVLFIYSSEIDESLTKSLVQKFFPEETTFNKTKLQFILKNYLYFVYHIQSVLKEQTKTVHMPYNTKRFIMKQYIESLKDDKLLNWNTEEFKEQWKASKDSPEYEEPIEWLYFIDSIILLYYGHEKQFCKAKANLLKYPSLEKYMNNEK